MAAQDDDPERFAKRMAIFDALPPDLRAEVNDGLDLFVADGLARRRAMLTVTLPADGGLQRKSRRAR